MRRTHPVPLVLLLAVLAGAGCYTVLQHPAGADLTDDAGSPRSCADCHADSDLYHYPSAYDPTWYGNYPTPWASYYDVPWWYDGYWYTPPQDRSGPGTPVETGARHLWSHEASGPGFLPTSGANNSSGSGASSGNQSTPTPTPPKNDSSKKDDSDKRHLWGH